MAFNPNLINTSMPPPNYPAMGMQFSGQQTNPCPPPVAQQHMFNTMMHVPPPNISASSNHLPSPTVGVGFSNNPIQTPPAMWNNNNPPNLGMVNGQSHNFNVAASPMPFVQNAQHQAQPSAINAQFQTSNFNNMPNNQVGLLAIGQNSSLYNSQQTFNNLVGSNFQSSAPLFNGEKNNSSMWPDSNFSINKSGIPSSNQVFANGIQNSFNQISNSNVWNPLQKTNVPDSNIFQNPNAIFGISSNNSVTSNGISTNSFPNVDSSTIFQPNMNNPGSFQNNFVASCNASLNKHANGYFGNSFEFPYKHKRMFNLPNNDYQSENPSYIKRQNEQLFQHKQNLIDVRVISNHGDLESKLSVQKFSTSDGFGRSNFSSTAVEEVTISDSESVESVNNKYSPQKHKKFKRFHENLQNVTSESNGDCQNKMGWMTESIQKALQKRNMLFKQARTTNDPAVWDEYNKLKNEINEEIRQTKLNTQNNKQNRNNINLRMWQDKEKKLPFNCDTCDRGFPSKDELDMHTTLHIKCHYTGCNFEAHPKIVSLHQRMQHDTGYADVINKLQDDEDIKKWREERKRRFPTAENILKKKAEQAEKEARGEVIEEKTYGRFKRGRFENGNRERPLRRQNRNNRKRKPPRNAFQKAPEIDLAQDSESEDESECPTKLPKFQGMKVKLEDLLANNDVKIEDEIKVKIEDADGRCTANPSPNEQGENCRVFSPPVNISSNEPVSYSNDQDKEDDDDAPIEIPIQRKSLIDYSDSSDENDDKPLKKENKQEVISEAPEIVSETPEAISETPEVSPSKAQTCDKKSDSNVKSSVVSRNVKDNRRERDERKRRPPVPFRPRNSLLQMLLSDEIRHERNVIMQCIRHIVRNNFFEVEANT